MNLKIFGTGEEKNFGVSAADAIRYAVDQGAKIISVSVAFGNVVLPKYFSATGEYEIEKLDLYFMLSYPESVREAYNYAWSKGVLVVCGAGNKASGIPTGLELAHYNTYSNHESVIQVGAIMPGINSVYHDVSMPGRSLDIVVPGSLFYGNTSNLGTSEATALAAGMIGLYWSYNLEKSHVDVKRRVIESARDRIYYLNVDSVYWHFGGDGIMRITNLDQSVLNYYRLWDDPEGWDEYYGYGMLNIEDLFLGDLKRSIQINEATGAVNNYVAPDSALLQDMPIDFQNWYNSIYRLEVKDGCGGGLYLSGGEVTIKANEDYDNMIFDHWLTNDTNIELNVTERNAAFKMPNNDVVVEAIFKEKIIDPIKLGVSKHLEFKVFPNPAKEYIKIESSEKILELNLVDLSGNTVKKVQNENSIQTLSIPKGVYVLLILTNNVLWKEKIIII